SGPKLKWTRVRLSILPFRNDAAKVRNPKSEVRNPKARDESPTRRRCGRSAELQLCANLKNLSRAELELTLRPSLVTVQTRPAAPAATDPKNIIDLLLCDVLSSGESHDEC